MKESKFGFEYSWADLQPIRALAFTVLLLQIAGLGFGLAFAHHSNLLLRAWFGGALITFPAFLLGLAIQSHTQPGSISENRVLVRRLGLIAFLLSGMAIAMPLLGFE